VQEVLRFRRCKICGELLFLCRRHDRNQKYCSDECRAVGYAATRRTARKKHRQSEEGAADHREAEQDRRRRRKACVADQTPEQVQICAISAEAAGAEEMPEVEKTAPDDEEWVEGRVIRLDKPGRCMVCGLESILGVWWPAEERCEEVEPYPRC